MEKRKKKGENEVRRGAKQHKKKAAKKRMFYVLSRASRLPYIFLCLYEILC